MASQALLLELWAEHAAECGFERTRCFRGKTRREDKARAVRCAKISCFNQRRARELNVSDRRDANEKAGTVSFAADNCLDRSSYRGLFGQRNAIFAGSEPVRDGVFIL
jgi:hypothetical protein